MRERLSRLGAAIGNLNDRTSSHDSRYYAGVRWVWVDRIASWLYTLPDRPRRTR